MSAADRTRLQGLASAQLTYAETGATRHLPLPPGYGHVHRDVSIGHAYDAFIRAADGLLTWEMHRRSGLAVTASAARAVTGAVVILHVAGLTIPCRVVYTADTAVTRGFAYGTLPGHPECGEEAFLISLAADGDVRARIRAFSRPASLLARAGGPLTRLVQQHVTNRYVRALRHVAGAGVDTGDDG